MSRKDFELIARVLREAHYSDHLDDLTVDELAERFASALSATNPNFNHSRFLRACEGLKEAA
jgi:hypothetical protein